MGGIRESLNLCCCVCESVKVCVCHRQATAALWKALRDRLQKSIRLTYSFQTAASEGWHMTRDVHQSDTRPSRHGIQTQSSRDVIWHKLKGTRDLAEIRQGVMFRNSRNASTSHLQAVEGNAKIIHSRRSIPKLTFDILSMCRALYMLAYVLKLKVRESFEQGGIHVFNILRHHRERREYDFSTPSSASISSSLRRWRSCSISKGQREERCPASDDILLGEEDVQR